jgi:hypothetical protein
VKPTNEMAVSIGEILGRLAMKKGKSKRPLFDVVEYIKT